MRTARTAEALINQLSTIAHWPPDHYDTMTEREFIQYLQDIKPPETPETE